jgi:hypothetical protein
MNSSPLEAHVLWYKSWLETRLWFFLAISALVAQVIALYMSYPMDPITTYPNGALGVLPHEMARLRTGDFRGYVWVRWFSTTMLVIWPVFALRLAGTGLERERGREYLLSLPVSRRAIVATRLAVVFLEIATFTLVPSLVVCAMAPLVGQRYPVSDVLAHSLILMAGGFGLFGLVTFLRSVTTDVAAYMAAAGVVVLLGLFTFVAKGFVPYSVFRLMNGGEYFFGHRVPWAGLALSLAVGTAFIVVSARMVEQRDF